MKELTNNQAVWVYGLSGLLIALSVMNKGVMLITYTSLILIGVGMTILGE